jgi:predicted phosphodiesterase
MNDFSNKKVLIFSDTHLTCKFDKLRFLALKKIIEEADIVIINGDFWEYISCPFEKFINSE